MYIENRIWGKAARASSVGVAADELLLRAATPWSSSVLQGESEKKSRCQGRRGHLLQEEGWIGKGNITRTCLLGSRGCEEGSRESIETQGP